MVKISLVLCTYGFNELIYKFFDSLTIQTFDNIELIVVDQNKHFKIKNIIKERNFNFSVKYFRSEKGLSKARNIGLEHITGDIVGFPDDDCFYERNTMEKIVNSYKENNFDGLIIRAKNSVKSGRKLHKNEKSRFIDKTDIFKLVHSISLFLSYEIIKTVGDFDENLGLGTDTVFIGQEDRDYPLRALKKGYNLYFDNEIIVHHPWDDEQLEKEKNFLFRAYGGASAEMYVINKHNFSNFFKIKRVFRKIGGIAYYLLMLNFYKSKASFNGLKGLINYWNYNDFDN